MAPLLNCDDVQLFYTDPATHIQSSCPELCNYRFIRVRRNDCQQYCPDYYYCIGRGSSTLKPCASTPDPEVAHGTSRVILELPYIVAIVFVIALLLVVVLIMCRMLQKQKKNIRRFPIAQEDKLKGITDDRQRTDSGISLMAPEENKAEWQSGTPTCPSSHGSIPKKLFTRESSESSGCSSL